MAREAPNEIIHLEHIGVTFHRNDRGELGTRAFGGASAARTYYVADITGQAILHVLYEQLMKYSTRWNASRSGSPPRSSPTRTARGVGCIARDIRTGQMEIFRRRNVILASGGAGQA
jgi:succinate dehydrogenase / fumarate reductase flavoprotein subunit